MNNQLKVETEVRLRKLQQKITDANADACIITSSVNQFWLCGFIFDGYLLLFPEGDPVLFVKRPAGITDERVQQIRKPEQIPDMLREADLSLPKRVLIESDLLSYSSVMRLQAALEMPEVINVSGELRRLRAVKSEYELNQIRESARIHTKVYELIP